MITTIISPILSFVFVFHSKYLWIFFFEGKRDVSNKLYVMHFVKFECMQYEFRNMSNIYANKETKRNVKKYLQRKWKIMSLEFQTTNVILKKLGAVAVKELLYIFSRVRLRNLKSVIYENLHFINTLFAMEAFFGTIKVSLQVCTIFFSERQQWDFSEPHIV